MGLIKTIGIWLLTMILLFSVAYFASGHLSGIAFLIAMLCFAGFPVVFSFGLTRIKGLANSKYLLPLQIAVIVFWSIGSNLTILGISTNTFFGLILYVAILYFMVRNINLSLKVRDSGYAGRLDRNTSNHKVGTSSLDALPKKEEVL